MIVKMVSSEKNFDYNIVRNLYLCGKAYNYKYSLSMVKIKYEFYDRVEASNSKGDI